VITTAKTVTSVDGTLTYADQTEAGTNTLPSNSLRAWRICEACFTVALPSWSATSVLTNILPWGCSTSTSCTGPFPSEAASCTTVPGMQLVTACMQTQALLLSRDIVALDARELFTPEEFDINRPWEHLKQKTLDDAAKAKVDRAQFGLDQTQMKR
jgi:hypothetical protein